MVSVPKLKNFGHSLTIKAVFCNAFLLRKIARDIRNVDPWPGVGGWGLPLRALQNLLFIMYIMLITYKILYYYDHMFRGVLWVTPHVHLIGCSDQDIMGDWTWHMFIRGSDISWGEIRYFHTLWGSIWTIINCCHDGWQNAHMFSSEGHMMGDWTYGRNRTVYYLQQWGQVLPSLLH